MSVRLRFFLLLLLLSDLVLQAVGGLKALPVGYVWSPPLNLSATAGRSTFPTIVTVGSDQDLLVVWTDYTTDPSGEILGRRYLRRTGAWSETLTLSLSPTIADEGPALYADAQRRAHLAWSRRDTGNGSDLLYRQWADGVWSPPQVLDHTDVYHPSPYGLTFVEDITGTLWLFVHIGSGVRHTRLQETGWEPLSSWVYIPGMSRLGDLIPGSDGRFHVAALGPNEDAEQGCDPYLEDAYYTTTDGTTWDDLLNLTYLGTVAYDVGLAYDGNGDLHFLWSDQHPLCSVDSERSAIYERVLSGGIWGDRAEVTVPNTDQAVLDLALQPDPDGNLHLLWSEGVFDTGGRAIDLAIRYRPWNAGIWGNEEIGWASSADSLNVSLTLDHLRQPAAVWEEGPSTAEEVTFSVRRLALPYRSFLARVDHQSQGP